MDAVCENAAKELQFVKPRYLASDKEKSFHQAKHCVKHGLMFERQYELIANNALRGSSEKIKIRLRECPLVDIPLLNSLIFSQVLLKLKGTGIQLIILTFFSNQFLVVAALDNLTVFQNANKIGVAYS